MKIALVTLTETINLSGEIESILNLYDSLKEKGIDVDLISPSKGNLHNRRSKKAVTGDTILKMHFDIPKLIKQINEKPYDLIQLYLPNPSLGYISDWINNKTNTKVITIFESALLEKESLWVLNDLPMNPMFYIMRFLCCNRYIAGLSTFNSTAYITSSEYQKSQMVQIGIKKRKIHTIPNLTSVSKYKRHNKNKVAKELKLDLKDRFVISYIGHLLHHKGVDSLFKVIPRILKDIPNALFIFAHTGLGNKDRLEKISKQYKKNVKVYGKVNVSKILSMSDVLVAPYLFNFGTNVFPSIILESFLLNVPVISTTQQSIKEIITNRKHGLLIKPREIKELHKALCLIHKDKRLVQRIKKHQTRLMKGRMNPKRLTNKYLSLYKKIIRGKENEFRTYT